MLKRTQIRQDVIERLTGKTTAGDKVFASKATPLELVDIPAILVYVPTNTAEQQNPQLAPESLFFSNELLVVLEVHAVGDSDDELDDALDTITGEIEDTLLKSQSWVKQFPIIGPIESDTVYETEGGRRRGVTKTAITIQYPTQFQLATP